ncbi:MAG TPA: hypothetical protein VKB65_13620 [Myxococcota bacterium]|nr:hypothetical protein [Myxococcota bacterium]
MRRWLCPALVPSLLLALAAGAPARADDPAMDTDAAVVPGQLAPRLQTLGSHAHAITTSSPRAQLFFNQGLILAYGFNHREAARSFREVVRLDPTAAMGYWGQALVLGPNINAPMAPEDEAKAWALIEQARSVAASVSPAERDYIEALAARYSSDPEPDRAALDQAYADAMRGLHEAHPDDLDAATLYAESLMDLSPWDYWTVDGVPYARTTEILSVLEAVRAVDSKHPGANHFLIHATEYAEPERAEAAADDLVNVAPGAGHLQHMPGHIYSRIGRYADASAANDRAIAADEDYIVACRAQGVYPLAYYPHNLHFLWWTSGIEGRSEVSIASARKVVEKTVPFLDQLPAFGKVFPASLPFALARFGRWDEILSEPLPDAKHPFWRGAMHYARGLAFARKGRLAEAYGERAAIEALEASPGADQLAIGASNLAQLLQVAAVTLDGEIAGAEGRYERAVETLHRAVLLQDLLPYNEPPDWYFPVRQSLGAVLLDAGRPAEAEAVYWDDLKQNPRNGWSLFGLAQAQRAQGKDEQAALAERRFQRAWEAADVELSASRF